MLAQTLAVFDIIAGIAIAGQMYWAWNPVTWIAVIMICKAVYSLATSIGSHFYFDFIGWLDLAVGIVIIFNFNIPYFFLLPLAKGIYSLVMIRM